MILHKKAVLCNDLTKYAHSKGQVCMIVISSSTQDN